MINARRNNVLALASLTELFLSGGAVCLLGAAPALAQVQSTPRTHSKPAYPALKAFADRIVEQGEVPGVVIAIGKGDASTTFIAAGRLSVEPSAPPPTPETLWRIFSMTKPVTGIVAMILVSDGRLTIDQPVSDFFPAYKTMGVYVDADKGGATVPARDLTIRHLLTHTQEGSGTPSSRPKL